jgi:hypothetical protein
MTTCNDDDAMVEQWAPFSPPDEFDVANAEWMPACVLALRGGRDGVPGGRNGGVKMCILIVQLGSQIFFDNVMHSSWHVITPSNSMVHI